jgi:hypothetical protein
MAKRSVTRSNNRTEKAQDEPSQEGEQVELSREKEPNAETSGAAVHNNEHTDRVRDVEDDEDKRELPTESGLQDHEAPAVTPAPPTATIPQTEAAALTEMQKHWPIKDMKHIFVDDTWLKDKESNLGFELATAQRLAELAQASRQKVFPERNRADAERMQIMKRWIHEDWDRRWHSRGSYRNAVGKTWPVKNEKMREAFEMITGKLKKGGLKKEQDIWKMLNARRDRAENAKEQEEGDQAVAGDAENGKGKQKRGKAAQEAQDPDAAASKRPRSGRSRARSDPPTTPTPSPNSSPPSPPWSHGKRPAENANKLLREKLKKYWKLSKESCRDAIPIEMRNKSWSGEVHTWGDTSENVLRVLCALACITCDKHADVLSWFRQRLDDRGDGSRLTFADLQSARRHFSPDSGNGAAVEHGDRGVLQDQDLDGYHLERSLTPETEVDIVQLATYEWRHDEAVDELRASEASLQETRSTETDAIMDGDPSEAEARVNELELKVAKIRERVADWAELVASLK